MNGVGKVITMPVGFNGVTIEPEPSMQMTESLYMGLRLAEYVEGGSPKPGIRVVAGTVVLPTSRAEVLSTSIMLEPPK
jgi:hypothetical protein